MNAFNPQQAENTACRGWLSNPRGGADTFDFLEFFEQAAEAENIYGRPALEVGDIVVMDNCPTHHNLGGDVLKEFLSNMNIELVYMPAYSPDFNPAELVFCKIRTVIRYELLYLTKFNLKYFAYSAAEMITPQDMEGLVCGILDQPVS